MSLEELLPIVQGTAEWPTSKEAADAALFKPLFGSPSGRYRETASKSVTLRANPMSGEDAVRFAAYIEPSNPPSGPYSGMSLVLFPAEPGQPCLISLVLGTNGLHPDEEILGRPGHARKAQALCAWLNSEHGNGKLVAWAKQDPVRIDTSVPSEIKEKFAPYAAVFSRYGRELYAIYAPTADEAKTREALAAFVDLMFAERGQKTLATADADADGLRSRWLAYLMPQVTPAEVVGLLESRRFVIVEGPPGTGKTRIAEELLKHEYGGRGFPIQFHPNTTYESFVGGLAPRPRDESLGLSFEATRGHLMAAAKLALDEPNGLPVLLHIDEINRADLAKVLGEAIYLFEPNTPRKIRLPFDFGAPFGSELSLPSNLHVLGTMNTADRSLAIVDVAVRRRFAFAKLWPQVSVVEQHGGALMLRAFNELVDIFTDHASGDAFNLIPGHSYFIQTDPADDEAARTQLKVTLVPLLEEYLSQGYVGGFSEEIRAYLQWIDSL